MSVHASEPARQGNLLDNQHELKLAVNAYIQANRALAGGRETAAKEKVQHLRTIQSRFWRLFFSVLSDQMTRRRGNLVFGDDERLCIDLGLVDQRMLAVDDEEHIRIRKKLLEEVNSKGLSGCYYLTEWFVHCQQQVQIENHISDMEENEDDSYASQLREARRRVLSRLGDLFTGLPGIPLEVSESMRTGDLDRALIASGINAIREPRRRNFLRRHNLWLLREQVLAKARARAGHKGALRLFELLNEVYGREWRARYDLFLSGEEEEVKPIPKAPEAVTESVQDPAIDSVMLEARMMRMRLVLMAAVEGQAEQNIVLQGEMPRLTKDGLAEFFPLVQSFDRGMTELPPVIIVPGTGRGFFAWETDCILLALRPLVGLDDSMATALAWYRIIDDRMNRGGELRKAYMARFPGAVFETDFAADYRAWLCRLTCGEVEAMSPERRAFFRDVIGPPLSGPLLPPNLRNVGPQTMMAICRRLEKQVAQDESDVKLHRRLAAVYWQQGQFESANLQFTAAMQLDPQDGETLFAAGMFMRGQGEVEAANECFRFGAERDTSSLWGIYCKDALQGLI
ncbi:MAG: hypothetical protein LUG50_00170 [Planctomycetaceae bacterium]|nr:hypothetical protein [Planctomycetaceae bacterium]